MKGDFWWWGWSRDRYLRQCGIFLVLEGGGGIMGILIEGMRGKKRVGWRVGGMGWVA